MEIACDESGHEGQKLVGGVTDVFVHASVTLSRAEADGCLAELRERIRSPAREYKANHLLREKHRAVLLWFLGPDGPVHGRGHVLIVDKLDLLLGALVPDAAALRRHGGTVAPALWADFLIAANRWLRGHDTALAAAAARVSVPMPADPGAPVDLDPLVPAIVHAIEHWRAASVVHDRQTVLTPDRLAEVHARTGARVRLVAARDDTRVQVADLLAGTVRRFASEALANRPDRKIDDLTAVYTRGRPRPR